MFRYYVGWKTIQDDPVESFSVLMLILLIVAILIVSRPHK